ncbi:hypothetical protein PC113_g23384 [Phytophthora cactorum]|uniref:Uncharacterized protein n=1 Tax=Phytophthora cactorum TaxID=29920 RepID=A0A8T0XUT2_9STRA|nr:hypothetical protein PC113_g23384 [Phytophthora cactorum]
MGGREDKDIQPARQRQKSRVKNKGMESPSRIANQRCSVVIKPRLLTAKTLFTRTEVGVVSTMVKRCQRRGCSGRKLD